MSLCRNSIQPFENKTSAQQRYYEKDCKLRCNYCDKKFTHKDRLIKHEAICEVTCFNFLHKLTHGGFDGKQIFTKETLVHYNGNYIPMNTIEFNNDQIDEPEPITYKSAEPIYVKSKPHIQPSMPAKPTKPDKPKPKKKPVAIGFIIDKPIADINDNISSDNSSIQSDDSEINISETDDNNVIYDNNNSIHILYDDYDGKLMEIKQHEHLDIIRAVVFSLNEITFYKSNITDDYDNIIYLRLVAISENQYLCDQVVDFDDVDFMNWRANNI